MTSTSFGHNQDNVEDAIKNQRCELKDDYDHKNDEIEYVIENVLFERQQQQQHPHQPSSFDTSIDIDIATVEYQKLSDAFNSVLLNSCLCSTTPSESDDSESISKDVDAVCVTYKTCPHGGNYIHSSNELVLNPNRHSKDLIYECSFSCKCYPGPCGNRLVQFGPRPNLQIIVSKLLHKQYGLRTNTFIPRGAFVCEYAGELLTRTEAQRRMKDHEKQHHSYNDKKREEEVGNISEPKDCNKMNYVLCLNEYSLDGENASSSSTFSSLQQTFVDPHLRGNIGRYLNHSCQPNCEILSVRVDCPIPKIAIFAKRDIDAGEELSFHYGGGNGNNVVSHVQPSKSNANAMQENTSSMSIPCLCGSDNCTKFLPNLKF